MKILIYLFIVIALVLIGFNSTKIDWNSPFAGDSIIALIQIMASLCAIVLLLILLFSKKIKEKYRNNK
ncbi:MAG: hypothetical protein ABJM06_09390 [Gilvibacter sp.]